MNYIIIYSLIYGRLNNTKLRNLLKKIGFERFAIQLLIENTKIRLTLLFQPMQS